MAYTGYRQTGVSAYARYGGVAYSSSQSDSGSGFSSNSYRCTESGNSSGATDSGRNAGNNSNNFFRSESIPTGYPAVATSVVQGTTSGSGSFANGGTTTLDYTYKTVTGPNSKTDTIVQTSSTRFTSSTSGSNSQSNSGDDTFTYHVIATTEVEVRPTRQPRIPQEYLITFNQVGGTDSQDDTYNFVVCSTFLDTEKSSTYFSLTATSYSYSSIILGNTPYFQPRLSYSLPTQSVPTNTTTTTVQKRAVVNTTYLKFHSGTGVTTEKRLTKTGVVQPSQYQSLRTTNFNITGFARNIKTIDVLIAPVVSSSNTVISSIVKNIHNLPTSYSYISWGTQYSNSTYSSSTYSKAINGISDKTFTDSRYVEDGDPADLPCVTTDTVVGIRAYYQVVSHNGQPNTSYLGQVSYRKTTTVNSTGEFKRYKYVGPVFSSTTDYSSVTNYTPPTATSDTDGCDRDGKTEGAGGYSFAEGRTIYNVGEEITAPYDYNLNPQMSYLAFEAQPHAYIGFGNIETKDSRAAFSYYATLKTSVISGSMIDTESTYVFNNVFNYVNVGLTSPITGGVFSYYGAKLLTTDTQVFPCGFRRSNESYSIDAIIEDPPVASGTSTKYAATQATWDTYSTNGTTFKTNRDTESFVVGLSLDEQVQQPVSDFMDTSIYRRINQTTYTDCWEIAPVYQFGFNSPEDNANYASVMTAYLDRGFYTFKKFKDNESIFSFTTSYNNTGSQTITNGEAVVFTYIKGKIGVKTTVEGAGLGVDYGSINTFIGRDAALYSDRNFSI